MRNSVHTKYEQIHWRSSTHFHSRYHTFIRWERYYFHALFFLLRQAFLSKTITLRRRVITMHFSIFPKSGRTLAIDTRWFFRLDNDV